MKGTRKPTRMPAKVLLLIVVVVAVVAGTGTWVATNATHQVSAYFRSTTGLYVGDRVMILGVPVGRVNEIIPEGDRVRVEFEYDGDYDVPVDAQAVIVAPVLVTGRYIQLAPAYTEGEKMQDGQMIPVERTAIPMEFDEVKEQVVKLAQDVGRTPENPDGSLNDFVANTADTLRGNGQTLHDSLVQLADATTTLSKGGETCSPPSGICSRSPAHWPPTSSKSRPSVGNSPPRRRYSTTTAPNSMPCSTACSQPSTRSPSSSKTIAEH